MEEQHDTPEAMGISSERLGRAFGILQKWVDNGTVPGVAAVVSRYGRIIGEYYAGRAAPGRQVQADTIFSLASVTKPFTAAGAMLLVERGLVGLDEPVQNIIPEFASEEHAAITLRHCLTHSSGLPEFPQENLALRQANAPLFEFTEAFYHTPLQHATGTIVSYCNIGFGLAAEMIHRLTGITYHRWVIDQILRPLGMIDTCFTPEGEQIERTAIVEGGPYRGTSYEMFNSPYHRSLGIPWGGLYAPARELIRFAHVFLNKGPVLSEPTIRVMLTNQVAGLPGKGLFVGDRPEADWGIGWELRGKKRMHRTGDLSSPGSFSHTGHSGTLLWGDPELGLACALLTNASMESWNTVLNWNHFNNALLASVVKREGRAQG